jgi:hypothetical protein
MKPTKSNADSFAISHYMCPGLLHRVVFWLYTNVSEEHTASIFRAKVSRVGKKIVCIGLRGRSGHRIGVSVCSSETSVCSQKTTRRNNPEIHHLLTLRRENLQSEFSFRTGRLIYSISIIRLPIRSNTL